MSKHISLSKRTLGVNFNNNGEAEILVWAPFSKKVAVNINGKAKNIALQGCDRGYHSLVTTALKPGDNYLFVLDDGKEYHDPASLSQAGGVHDASTAIDLANFTWTDQQWTNPDLDRYIIYEVHTGTFSDDGTFKGVADKIEYLKSLGITAIELMPVAQFPGNRNWGYDGVLPYAVQDTYGGAEQLMQLVDSCHKNGIAVILDVVYNHVGPEGNYFGSFGNYFTDKYHTPWGSAINFDDAYSDEVRRYFIENVLMWFRDFHIDALRMDAVHAIKDLSPKHLLKEFKENVNELMQLNGRNYHLTIEFDLNDNRFINPIERDGYGMDAQWIDEFHHALRVVAGEKKEGYYSEFNGIGDLAKSYTGAYVYDGIYSEQRKKTFGTKTEGNSGDQFIVFSQNHDQVGNRMLGERSSQLFSFEMQKLMAGAVMISPFVPMLFMGEEWSANTPFQYFISHTDPKLVKAVQKGRIKEFSYLHSKHKVPDPQSEETFLNSKLNWNEVEKGKHALMLSYYKALIALRKKLPALSHLNRENLSVIVNEEQHTLQILRWHDNQYCCSVLNFSDRAHSIVLPEKHIWHQVINSADKQWNGPGVAGELTVQPESMTIYVNSHV